MPGSRIRKRTSKTKGTRWAAVHEFRDPATGLRTSECETFDLKREAEAFLAKRKAAERTDGEVVKASKKKTGELFDEWLEEGCSEKTPATRAGYAEICHLYLRPSFEAIPLAEVTRNRIQRCIDGLRKRGLSPTTVRLSVTVLRVALSYAVAEGLLPRNPVRINKDDRRRLRLPPKKKNHEKNTSGMSREEAAAFIEALSEEKLRPLFLVLLFAGLRPSEAFALRFSDFADLDGDAPTVSVSRSVRRVKIKKDEPAEIIFGDPKTAAAFRTVSLPPDVAEAVLATRVAAQKAALKDGRSFDVESLAFPAVGSTDIPLDRHNVRRIFRRILRRAGLGETIVSEGRRSPRHKFVPKFRLYDLRHSSASLLLAAGVDVRTVADRLGHTDAGFTLQTYAHSSTETRHDAAMKLAALVSNGD